MIDKEQISTIDSVKAAINYLDKRPQKVYLGVTPNYIIDSDGKGAPFFEGHNNYIKLYIKGEKGFKECGLLNNYYKNKKLYFKES